MRTLLEEIMLDRELTERDMEVLVLCAEGRTTAWIADKLILSEDTVRQYRKRTIAKLGARNMTHAVAISLRRGLIV